MASPLEQFVNNVRSLSSQGSYREVYEMISKSNELLSKNGVHLDTVLETLNFQQHSLGVLAVMLAKFSLPPALSNQETLFTQMQGFINGCNGEQVRFAPEIYAELCHSFTRWLVDRKTPARGIELLKKAILKIQLFDSQLTSIHADLCQLCLLSKNMKPALELLETDITSINQEGSLFDSEYFLRFFYYGGMIYTALKNLDRAIYFYEVAITTPALAVSHIMLEAYKKYILVSLILHGKVGAVPKYTSQVVGRFIKPLSQPYHELATAYATNKTADVRAVLHKYHDTFARDNNTGLSKQVMTSLTKKNIQRLTKTFLTLSLSDVASRVQLPGPSDAERLILNMIEDGEIFATINQKDGMVVFHEDPEKYNSPAMLQQLRDEMMVCIELDRKILGMEEEIMVNPQFVKKSCGNQEEDSMSPATSAQTSKATTYSM